MWAALSFMEKARLMASLLHLGSAKVAPSDMRQEIERLKEVDVLAAAVAQFGRTYPHVLGPLVVSLLGVARAGRPGPARVWAAVQGRSASAEGDTPSLR